MRNRTYTAASDSEGDDKQCGDCQCSSTPQWRKGPGGMLLCNACWVRRKRHPGRQAKKRPAPTVAAPVTYKMPYIETPHSYRPTNNNHNNALLAPPPVKLPTTAAAGILAAETLLAMATRSPKDEDSLTDTELDGGYSQESDADDYYGPGLAVESRTGSYSDLRIQVRGSLTSTTTTTSSRQRQSPTSRKPPSIPLFRAGVLKQLQNAPKRQLTTTTPRTGVFLFPPLQYKPLFIPPLNPSPASDFQNLSNRTTVTQREANDNFINNSAPFLLPSSVGSFLGPESLIPTGSGNAKVWLS